MAVRSPRRISRCFNFQTKSFLTVVILSHCFGESGKQATYEHE
jgi:hypothetical protein